MPESPLEWMRDLIMGSQRVFSTPFPALVGLLLGSSRTADVLVTEIVKERKLKALRNWVLGWVKLKKG